MRALLPAAALALLAGCVVPGLGGSTVFLLAEEEVRVEGSPGTRFEGSASPCAPLKYAPSPPSLTFLDDPDDAVAVEPRPAGVLVLNVHVRPTDERAPDRGDGTRALVLAEGQPVALRGAGKGAPVLANVTLRGDEVLVDGQALGAGASAEKQGGYIVKQEAGSLHVHETLRFRHLGRVTPAVEQATGPCR